MSRIAETFTALRARGHMAFMPFVTAGDPDMPATLAVIRELAAAGVDLIEVGFPYSDPIADGPVIQAAYTRALAKKLHVSDIFAGIASLPTDELPPLVAMVSFAIVFRTGTEAFLKQARAAGFAGLIVPDLPGDEASELGDAARRHGLDLIELIAPTTPPERAERILATASGFVYCISVAGTTGARDELPPALVEQLGELRRHTDLPLAVGFGISRPEQVASLRGHADGVIVGSAIVRRMEAMGESDASRAAALAEIRDFAVEFVSAARG
ncbi:MAG: tryptophan synthase subunit alpha [Planctomycetaceae bacterium]